MGKTYFILYEADGHRFYASLRDVGSDQELQESLLGFKTIADDESKVRAVTDFEEARKWENSCFHYQGAERNQG